MVRPVRSGPEQYVPAWLVPSQGHEPRRSPWLVPLVWARSLICVYGSSRRQGQEQLIPPWLVPTRARSSTGRFGSSRQQGLEQRA